MSRGLFVPSIPVNSPTMHYHFFVVVVRRRKINEQQQVTAVAWRCNNGKDGVATAYAYAICLRNNFQFMKIRK